MSTGKAKPKLSKKEEQKASAALKRITTHDYKNATAEQKAKAALDLVTLARLIGLAWPIIEMLLRALKLPIPDLTPDD